MSAIKTKERPILFSGSMIRAILEGRKTQTRRIIKLPSWSTQSWEDFEVYENKSVETICASTGCSADILCPYGKKGDWLWVRETWAPAKYPSYCNFAYKADFDEKPDFVDKWEPSIFMPRSTSRINLIIKNIRVERLQEISEEDAIAEGVYQMSSGYWTGGEHPAKGTPKHMISPVEGFKDLWDSINSNRGYSWDSNPFVWVVEFERVID